MFVCSRGEIFIIINSSCTWTLWNSKHFKMVAAWVCMDWLRASTAPTVPVLPWFLQLGHHITCKSCQNKFRDVFVECCRRANVSDQVELEVGSGFGHDKRNTRPADVLVPNWSLEKPAAFYLTITSVNSHR